VDIYKASKLCLHYLRTASKLCLHYLRKQDKDEAGDIYKAIRLFLDFLSEQEEAYRILKLQHPRESVDLYRNRIEDLLANLKVLMYYLISPNQLDSLLKLNKAHRNFKFLNETGVPLEAYGKAVENLQILLYGQGQLNAFKQNRPVDAQGAPIPWITYAAFEFLSQFDYAESTIFEFGSGNSTLFWAGRARKVISIETNKEWFEALYTSKPPNVELYCLADGVQFAGSILKTGQVFDVIVIDSAKYRYAAAVNAIKSMAAGGIVIFDNTDWYPNACRMLRDAGLLQIDFHGLGPINAYAWTTSIFFKDRIKFRRLADNARPIGGIVVEHDDDAPTSATAA